MKLQAINETQLFLTGISDAWTEANKDIVEYNMVTVDSNYLPYCDTVRYHSPATPICLLDALNTVYVTWCKGTPFSIGPDPEYGDEPLGYFPSQQNMSIIYDKDLGTMMVDFEIVNYMMMEDVIAFYTEILSQLDLRDCVARTSFETAILQSVHIKVDFDYVEDFFGFLSWVTEVCNAGFRCRLRKNGGLMR